MPRRARPLVSLLPWLLTLCGCSDSALGVEVEVQLAAPAAAPAWQSALGPLQLDRAHLALLSTELVGCDAAASTALRAQAQAPSTALRAQHVEGSPTRLGVPALLALSWREGPLPIGTMLPPPGRYCHVELVYAPADHDAVGLTDPGDVGVTLHVQGRARLADGSERELHVASRGRRVVRMPLAAPLELDVAGQRRATLHIGLDAEKVRAAFANWTPQASTEGPLDGPSESLLDALTDASTAKVE